MIRRPPRSTQSGSSAASDVYKRQLINGAWQVTQNSWDCLLVEDVDREDIPKVYSLVKIAADFSALFAPIAALLVSNFGLVPAVRLSLIHISEPTRLLSLSYAVFCLKKKHQTPNIHYPLT